MNREQKLNVIRRSIFGSEVKLPFTMIEVRQYSTGLYVNSLGEIITRNQFDEMISKAAKKYDTVWSYIHPKDYEGPNLFDQVGAVITG